jgi:hypothetical protein
MNSQEGLSGVCAGADMKLKSVLCAVVILLLAVNPSFCIAGAGPGITPEDVAVLRAVLSCRCRKEDGNYNVVSDMPVSPIDYALDWPSRSLRAELATRVPDGIRWPHLNICPAVRIVDGKKVDSIFTRQTAIPPNWKPFYAAFPGARGLLRISLPVFTPDRRRAVVYLEAECDSLCGSGFYIELTLKGAEWRISRQENAWIS